MAIQLQDQRARGKNKIKYFSSGNIIELVGPTSIRKWLLLLNE